MAEPLRIMSLHALAYCERLFYLEEVEELRVADERVYAGRQLHAVLEKNESLRTAAVLGQSDFARRKKKSRIGDKKAPWEDSAQSRQDTEPDETDGERVSLSLESEKWGLTGKVDCLRRRDGMLIPYEHKRGRAARSFDNKPSLGPAIVFR